MAVLLTIVSNLGLILKFWDKVETLIKTLEVTPEEKHAKLMEALSVESERLKNEGRPVWDT